MIPMKRHVPVYLLRKFKRLFEPRLDAERVLKVSEEFDRKRGYDAWQAYCRAELTRPVPADAPAGPLLTTGYTVLEAMPAAAAGELLSAVSAHQNVVKLKRDTTKLEGYEVDDPALLERLLSSALGAAVDACCLEFFRSEYLVHWFTVTRTVPGPSPGSVSFRWHCDRGPRAHLKLLVYLNDFSEHRGGTAYLDLAQSDAVARSGYLFALGRHRTGSLADLAQLCGEPLQAYDHQPRAGDAVLFQPSRVLHSGVMPTLGPRYVLTLCLLPSPVPWRTALARGAQVDLRSAPLWHDHTDDLARALAVPATWQGR